MCELSPSPIQACVMHAFVHVMWQDEMIDFSKSLEIRLQYRHILKTISTVIIGGFPVNSSGAIRAPTDPWGPMHGFLSTSFDPEG